MTIPFKKFFTDFYSIIINYFLNFNENLVLFFEKKTCYPLKNPTRLQMKFY